MIPHSMLTAANAMRGSYRRLLGQVAAAVQAELRLTGSLSPPTPLPSLLSCLHPSGAATHGVPAALSARDHCHSYASQAAAAAMDADRSSPEAQSGARPAQLLPRDAAQLTGSIDGMIAGSGRSPSRSRKTGLLHNTKVPLRNWAGDVVGHTILPGAVFDVDVRRDILHRVVRWQLAKRQQGTHKAKTRREVRGGGRKPWNQKGTGRARAGTIRAPQWRGGGKAHGPVPRSHEHDLQRKVRQAGLRCALSAKAHEGRLIVLDTLAVPEAKTRFMDTALEALLADAPRRSVLLIDTAKDGADGGASLRLASGNLPWVDVLPAVGANVYSILQRDYLLLSRDAVATLTERGSRFIHRKPERLRSAAARAAGRL